MNSFETLETILRGRRPRRPSDTVRAALFGPANLRPNATRLATGAPDRPGPMQVWFAPFAAAAVLVLSLGSLLPPAGSPGVQDFAVAALGTEWQTQVGPIEHNLPPTPSFRSTTGAALAPSFGFLLLRQTNALVR